MAVWVVAKLNGNVKLTYVSAGVAQECGSSPGALEEDLLGWVIDTAAVWDRIETAGGTFIRQASGVFGTRA